MAVSNDAIPTYGIVHVTLEARILEIDAGFASLIGLAPEQAVGRLISEFTDEPPSGSPQMMINIIMRTGEPMSVRRTFVRPDGSRIVCNVQICLLRDGVGRPHSVIGVAQIATR